MVVYVMHTKSYLHGIKKCKRNCSLSVGSHSNIAANALDTKKSVRFLRVLAVTELTVL